MSSPKFKFPRVEAGLYQIVMDKVGVGLIQKQVEDKEVCWWIHETTSREEMGAVSSVGNPDELLREAKETAQKYFTDKFAAQVKQPQQVQAVQEEKGILDDLNVEEDLSDALNEFDDFELDFTKNLVNV